MSEIKGYKKNILVNDQISIYKTIICIDEILENRKLSISEKNVLSYYCAFKTAHISDKMILEHKIVGSPQVLYNMKTKLKKKGLLVAHKKTLRICDYLNFDILNNSSFVISKITAKEIIKFKEENDNNI